MGKTIEEENRNLCNMYAEVVGSNAHDLVKRGWQPDRTLHLVLRLRGGMYEESSGREDYGSVLEDGSEASFHSCNDEDLEESDHELEAIEETNDDLDLELCNLEFEICEVTRRSAFLQAMAT